jgi:hypothetical protein
MSAFVIVAPGCPGWHTSTTAKLSPPARPPCGTTPPSAASKTPWPARPRQSWLDGAASPIARVLDKLSPSEQEAFLKAMDLLETELRRQDTPSAGDA